MSVIKVKKSLEKRELVVRDGVRYLVVGLDLKRIHRIRRHNKWQYCIENKCQWCEKEFKSDIYDQGKYCSRSCVAKATSPLGKNKIIIPGESNDSLVRLGKMTVFRAVQKDQLVRPKECPVCKKITNKIEGHHPDYYEPRQINWVCVSCHKKIHYKHKFDLELIVF